MGEVMGIVNVTPDSFSDGGAFVGAAGIDHQAAIDRGRQMFADGASIVDVGGESTRPGADPVGTTVELDRVLPVVETLAREGTVSIDTRHADVAREAVAAGASIINDVSASLHRVAAETGAGWVAMHMLGDPRTMQADPSYDDVVADITEFLVERAEAAADDGVERIWIDPGIGFGKTTAHNLSLIKHVRTLVDTGFPVLLGASRKRFLGEILTRSDVGDLPSAGPLVPTSDRREGSVTVATWAFGEGVDILRVHDVKATVQAGRVVGVIA